MRWRKLIEELKASISNRTLTPVCYSALFEMLALSSRETTATLGTNTNEIWLKDAECRLGYL